MLIFLLPFKVQAMLFLKKIKIKKEIANNQRIDFWSGLQISTLQKLEEIKEKISTGIFTKASCKGTSWCRNGGEANHQRP